MFVQRCSHVRNPLWSPRRCLVANRCNTASVKHVHASIVRSVDQSTETFIFACGGTGGHITPALAVAEELQRRVPKCQVKFWGNVGGLESVLVPQHGFQFEHMPHVSFHRPFLDVRNTWRAFRLLFYFLQHVHRLCTVHATAVVGTGGYAAFPACLAAVICRKPLFLIEPNAVPGLANRLLALLCTTIFITHPSAGDMLPTNKIILSGTPVRAAFGAFDKHAARRALHLDNDDTLLTVVGGSSGSHQLSSTIIPIIPSLLRLFPKLHIHHQCGPKTKHTFKMTACISRRYHETKFFENMAEQFAASDLVLARSGALTCAEMLQTGVPSVLWPLIPSADNHQAENAKAMVQSGASVIFRHTSECPSSPALLILLSDILGHHGRLSEMQTCARTSQDAAATVVREMLQLPVCIDSQR